MTEPEAPRAVPLTEARATFTQLVNEARYAGQSTTIMQHSTAAARIVPPTGLVLVLDPADLARLEQTLRTDPATGSPESLDVAAARLLTAALNTGAEADS
jgi:prevent-host-death family protein